MEPHRESATGPEVEGGRRVYKWGNHDHWRLEAVRWLPPRAAPLTP